jgi:hypothetical protein
VPCYEWRRLKRRPPGRRQRLSVVSACVVGIANSTTFMNYAVWESVGAFKTAFENPEFRRHITDYPPSAVSRPHLFRKVSVPGICVSG